MYDVMLHVFQKMQVDVEHGAVFLIMFDWC